VNDEWSEKRPRKAAEATPESNAGETIADTHKEQSPGTDSRDCHIEAADHYLCLRTVEYFGLPESQEGSDRGAGEGRGDRELRGVSQTGKAFCRGRQRSSCPVRGGRGSLAHPAAYRKRRGVYLKDRKRLIEMM